jgi:hypothetical protein
MRDDEDAPIAPWIGEQVYLEPGEYEAIVTGTKKVERFGLVTVEFVFRIVSQGPGFDATLPGYCNLGPVKAPRIRPRSKMASWQRAVAHFTGVTPSKVTLKAFRQFWFRVRVATTTQDHRKRPLHPRDHYSAVVDIVDVIGKLAELPRERQGSTGEAS